MRKYNFGAGRPDPSSFPSEKLAQAAAKVIAEHGAELVNYPDGRGYRGLREIAAQRFERSGGKTVPLEEIVLTSGSMQAMQLITEALVQPGETIVVEEHTYGGSLGVFRGRQVKMASAPMDDQGLIMDELEALLKRLTAAGTPPKFIYTIASHQNPAGSILPLERRQRLLELAHEYDTLVVDDHCYGDIIFQEAPAPPTLYTLDTDNRVVYVASFSKVLGPGVRLGYFMAPNDLQGRIMQNKRDGGTNALASMILAEYFRDHLWDHIANINRIMKARKDAVVHGLATHFTDMGEEVWWTDPPGGLFVWVRIPDATDTKRAMALASERGVIYAPGQAFSPENEDIPFLRIAYGFPSMEDIHDGMPILADCVRAAQRAGVAAE
jgi:2-aminoadipate transaminase